MGGGEGKGDGEGTRGGFGGLTVFCMCSYLSFVGVCAFSRLMNTAPAVSATIAITTRTPVPAAFEDGDADADRDCPAVGFWRRRWCWSCWSWRVSYKPERRATMASLNIFLNIQIHTHTHKDAQRHTSPAYLCPRVAQQT